MDLVSESISKFLPTNVQVYECNTNTGMQGSTSKLPVESFTEMLNSQEDDCGNESNGGS